MTQSSAELNIAAPAEQFLPGPVLLLGAPGVGKGTQAQILMGEFGIPQISTGDLLRDHRKRGTELGLRFESFLAAGKLVPDDVINDMVATRLQEPDARNGYILDGYPRTLGQAEWLDAHIAHADAANESALPVIAVAIVVPEDELRRRITGRRMSATGCIYNIYTKPPQVPGICDEDGSALTQRADDTEEVFDKRMAEFHAKTAAVIEHYRGAGRFREIDGSLPIDQVTDAVRTALRELRQS